jgi:hypothetical protein
MSPLGKVLIENVLIRPKLVKDKATRTNCIWGAELVLTQYFLNVLVSFISSNQNCFSYIEKQQLEQELYKEIYQFARKLRIRIIEGKTPEDYTDTEQSHFFVTNNINQY